MDRYTINWWPQFRSGHPKPMRYMSSHWLICVPMAKGFNTSYPCAFHKRFDASIVQQCMEYEWGICCWVEYCEEKSYFGQTQQGLEIMEHFFPDEE